MGEFDLDLQVGSNAYGWESVFRPQPWGTPGAARMPGLSLPVTAATGCHPSDPGSTACGTCATCGPGATGSPCAC